MSAGRTYVPAICCWRTTVTTYIFYRLISICGRIDRILKASPHIRIVFVLLVGPIPIRGRKRNTGIIRTTVSTCRPSSRAGGRFPSHHTWRIRSMSSLPDIHYTTVFPRAGQANGEGGATSSVSLGTHPPPFPRAGGTTRGGRISTPAPRESERTPMVQKRL